MRSQPEKLTWSYGGIQPKYFRNNWTIETNTSRKCLIKKNQHNKNQTDIIQLKLELCGRPLKYLSISFHVTFWKALVGIRNHEHCWMLLAIQTLPQELLKMSAIKKCNYF